MTLLAGSEGRFPGGIGVCLTGFVAAIHDRLAALGLAGLFPAATISPMRASRSTAGRTSPSALRWFGSHAPERSAAYVIGSRYRLYSLNSRNPIQDRRQHPKFLAGRDETSNLPKSGSLRNRRQAMKLAALREARTPGTPPGGCHAVRSVSEPIRRMEKSAARRLRISLAGDGNSTPQRSTCRVTRCCRSRRSWCRCGL